jgi:hypothetical protein
MSAKVSPAQPYLKCGWKSRIFELSRYKIRWCQPLTMQDRSPEIPGCCSRKYNQMDCNSPNRYYRLPAGLADATGSGSS